MKSVSLAGAERAPLLITLTTCPSVRLSVRQTRSTHIRQHFWFVPHNGSFKQVQNQKNTDHVPPKHCPWSVNNKLKVYETRGPTSVRLTRLCKVPHRRRNERKATKIDSLCLSVIDRRGNEGAFERGVPRWHHSRPLAEYENCGKCGLRSSESIPSSSSVGRKINTSREPVSPPAPMKSVTREERFWYIEETGNEWNFLFLEAIYRKRRTHTSQVGWWWWSVPWTPRRNIWCPFQTTPGA